MDGAFAGLDLPALTRQVPRNEGGRTVWKYALMALGCFWILGLVCMVASTKKRPPEPEAVVVEYRHLNSGFCGPVIPEQVTRGRELQQRVEAELAKEAAKRKEEAELAEREAKRTEEMKRKDEAKRKDEEEMNRKIAELTRQRRAEEERDFDGLALRRHTVAGSYRESDYGPVSGEIVGEVINRRPKTVGFVRITINLYDADENRIGTTSASISNLEAGSTWKFRAPVFGRFHAFKVVKLTGW
jgi:hypothetical protein